MADEEDIVQNIKINVDDDSSSSAFDKLKNSAQSAFDSIKQIFEKGDFSASFEKIKEAGASAFDAFKQAGASAAETFKKFKDIGSDAFAELSDIIVANAATIGKVVLGIAAAFTAIGVAIVLAGKALFNFVESTSKALDPLSGLSDKTNTAIQTLSELQTAFGHAGVSAQDFVSGYSKLSDVVGKTWEQIKKDTENGVNDLESKSIAAAKSAQRLTDAQRERTGNTPDTNTKAIEAQRAKDLAFQEAQLANSKAQKAEQDARRNDINQVTKGVQDLIAGNQEALKNFNASADNIVKGVVAAAGQGSAALNGLGESFASVGSKAPAVKDVLTTLGAALTNIEDPALRSKVAVAALGKSGEDFITAFKSGNLDSFINKVREMGSAVDEADKKIANDFKAAMEGLGQDLDNVKTKMSSAFGPGFIDILKSLDEFFVRNQDNIKRFAETIASVLMPPLKLAATAFVAIGEAASLSMDVLRNLFKLLNDIYLLKGLAILEDFKSLYNILKAVAEILSGDVKKGLDDLAKERNREKKADDDNAATKRKAADDEIKSKTSQPDKAIPDSRVPQTDQQRQDTQDKKLQDDFKKFQDSLSSQRFDRQDLTQAQKDSADFQKFKQQGTQSQSNQPEKQQESTASRASNDLLEGLKNLLSPSAAGDQIKRDLNGGVQEDFAKIGNALSDAVTKSLTSIPDVLKNIFENGTPKPNDQLNAATPTSSSEASRVPLSESPLLQGFKSLLESIGSLVNKPGGLVTDPSAIGIRGDAEDKAAQSATQLASALDAATQAAQTKTTDNNSAEQANQALQSTAASAQSASQSLDAVSTVGQKVASVGESATTASSSLNSTSGAADTATSALQNLAAAAEAAATAAQSGGGGGAVAVATGGWIHGPGSETSDSIPAWLSHNEFVQPAKATRHYGVDFMESIRNLSFPKFNTGGLVGLLSPQLPRFAMGGPVNIGSSAGMPHLGSVDLTTDHGTVRVAADRDGLSQLRRASVMRNIGKDKQPSWVK